MNFPFSRFTIFPAIGLIFALSTLPARAALTIIAEETGGDVVFTFSGTIDTTGSSFDDEFNPETAFDPSNGEIEAWQTTTDTIFLNLQATVPFGSGMADYESAAGAGDNIAIFGDELFLDDDYISGSPLNATLTFPGETLASLGVDAAGGPYVWTLTGSGDTITMRFPQTEAAEATAAIVKTSLQKKIKKLKKKARKLKKRGKKAKAKKLLKKSKKLKKQLAALG